jgi:hypothetical protein
MELKDFFLMQLEQETTLTRKVIERVPEGHNDWKPHTKSMALAIWRPWWPPCPDGWPS